MKTPVPGWPFNGAVVTVLARADDYVEIAFKVPALYTCFPKTRDGYEGTLDRFEIVILFTRTK